MLAWGGSEIMAFDLGLRWGAGLQDGAGSDVPSHSNCGWHAYLATLVRLATCLRNRCYICENRVLFNCAHVVIPVACLCPGRGVGHLHKFEFRGHRQR